MVRPVKVSGEFAEHFRQKRFRYVALCKKCLDTLSRPHYMVDITGFGDECVWCGTHNRKHVPAIRLVDRRMP